MDAHRQRAGCKSAERTEVRSLPSSREARRMTSCSARERAAVLFLGRARSLRGLRSGRAPAGLEREDVPLVLDLVGRQRRRPHTSPASSDDPSRGNSPRASSAGRTWRPSRNARRSSAIRSTSVSFIACATILSRDVVAPGLVLRRLAVFLGEGRDERLACRACRSGDATPAARCRRNCPCPRAQATAVSKPKPATGNVRPNSAYCLRKLVIWLPARLDHDEIGLGVADLEQDRPRSRWRRSAPARRRRTGRRWPP